MILLMQAYPVPIGEAEIVAGPKGLPLQDTPFGRLSGAICYEADHHHYVHEVRRTVYVGGGGLCISLCSLIIMENLCANIHTKRTVFAAWRHLMHSGEGSMPCTQPTLLKLLRPEHTPHRPAVLALTCSSSPPGTTASWAPATGPATCSGRWRTASPSSGAWVPGRSGDGGDA